MADQNQLTILKQGAAAWNNWRAANAQTKIDLTGANLAGVNLSGADLSGADLHRATLIQADLNGADFTSANLREADLTHAHIRGTRFLKADSAGADFHSVHPDDQTIWPPLPRAAKLQYLYLLRVPILIGTALFAFPVVSLFIFRSLLGNL